MSIRFFLFCIVWAGALAVPGSAVTQLWFSSETPDASGGYGGILRTGLGWTRIAASDTGSAIHYATLTLNPEFKLGRIHGGLTLDLLVNTRDDPGGSQLRQTELRPGHLIRYVRYGDRADPWYLHLGALDRVTLGRGFILSRYSNQVADERRRVGVWSRIQRPNGGMETVVSNLSDQEVLGVRAFYLPFGSRPETLLFHTMEIGFTIVIDDNPSRGRTRFSNQTVEIVGLDMEIPVIKNPRFSLVPYGDFAKILDRGMGGAAGVRVDVPEVGALLSLSGRIEQQYLGAEFSPEFFDERYEVTSVFASGETKDIRLIGLPGTTGIAGALRADILDRLTVQGAYRAYTGRDSSGVLHLEAHLPDVVPRLTVRALYDKQNIRGFSDLRTLDDRSVLLAEVMYRAKPYLLIGFDYRWTFIFDEHPDIQTYRPQERFMAKMVFEARF